MWPTLCVLKVYSINGQTCMTKESDVSVVINLVNDGPSGNFCAWSIYVACHSEKASNDLLPKYVQISSRYETLHPMLSEGDIFFTESLPNFVNGPFDPNLKSLQKNFIDVLYDVLELIHTVALFKSQLMNVVQLRTFCSLTEKSFSAMLHVDERRKGQCGSVFIRHRREARKEHFLEGGETIAFVCRYSRGMSDIVFFLILHAGHVLG